VAVPDPVGSVICTRLDIKGPLYRLDNNAGGLAGYYYVHASDHHPALFIKVVDSQRAVTLQAADDIARFVADHGVSTSCQIPDYTKVIDGQWYALTYPYFEARFARLEDEDLRHSGRLLAQLHRTLARAPFQAQIKHNTAERELILKNTQQQLADSSENHIREEAVDIILHNTLDYPDCGWPKQIIHGDVNYGNLLFPIETPDRPVILDFEDTDLSWHSPLVDLAFMIERFILIRTDDDKLAYSLCQSLIAAYREYADKPPPPLNSGSLTKTLQLLSARALTLLAALTLENTPVASGEWDKFIFLYSQVQGRKQLINNIESLLNQ